MIYPFGLGLYYSFTSYTVAVSQPVPLRLVRRTTSACSTTAFLRALEFTLGFTLAAVVLQVGLGLAVALFLHGRVPGRSVIAR